MGESFTIQINTNLVKHLLDDGEKFKKKTKKPKLKIPQEPPKSLGNKLSDDSQTIKIPPSAEWPHQPPLYLPIPPPHLDNAELDGIKSILKESRNVVDRLQQQEENMLHEVTQRAKVLHDKEFKLPDRKLMPCLDEKDACLKCYKEHFENPLKCSNVAKNFADCARRIRR